MPTDLGLKTLLGWDKGRGHQCFGVIASPVRWTEDSCKADVAEYNSRNTDRPPIKTFAYDPYTRNCYMSPKSADELTPCDGARSIKHWTA
jgi:hypothetical protein